MKKERLSCLQQLSKINQMLYLNIIFILQDVQAAAPLSRPILHSQRPIGRADSPVKGDPKGLFYLEPRNRGHL